MVARKKPLECPICGGHEIIRKGFRDQKSGTTVQRLQCKSCMSKFTLGALRARAIPHQHQTGKTIVDIDRKRRAKRPGRRVSKNGNVYWEFRRNRTDVDPLKGL